jgi:hypothetical protein
MTQLRDLLLGPLMVSVSAIKQGRNRSRINENVPYPLIRALLVERSPGPESFPM